MRSSLRSRWKKVLYTIDELTGLITADAYMRPSKSVRDMDVKSVMKNFNSSAFAADVDKEVIIISGNLGI